MTLDEYIGSSPALAALKQENARLEAENAELRALAKEMREYYCRYNCGEEHTERCEKWSEALKTRWPEYQSKTLSVGKRSQSVHDYVVSLPGWEFKGGEIGWMIFPSLIEEYKQKIADMEGAIAHMEAHPEDE